MPSQPRRSQETRRAEMRERLMDAALACLVEVGYAKTSTTLISRRAGVSRGAQLHHFPTREDLMLATIEHVADARRARFREAMASTEGASGTERLVQAVQRMWEAVEGAPTQAWLELVVAARNDPALHARVVAVTERMRAGAREELARLGADTNLPPDALQLASALMDGLVIQQMAGLSDARRDGILALLKRLVTTFQETP